ncbi:MAG: hemolysin III family protein [Trueperaceae bacterium]|nr:hemolysin III family protein [Trueperaceae bacterium]
MRTAPSTPWITRVLREPANSLTHLLGVALSLVGLVFLIALAGGDVWRLTSFAIYGASLVVLYTASTLLHAVRARPEVLRRLRIFDHAAIFVLIAGTYTPVTLVSLRMVSPVWGWTLFATAWGFAILGVLFKVAWIGAPRWLSTALYVALGWMAAVAVAPLAQALEIGALVWLLAGGLSYTLGAVVYGTRRPDPWPSVFGYHALWHLFVLVGSACHFVMVIRYIALA